MGHVSFDDQSVLASSDEQSQADLRERLTRVGKKNVEQPPPPGNPLDVLGNAPAAAIKEPLPEAELIPDDEVSEEDSELSEMLSSSAGAGQ